MPNTAAPNTAAPDAAAPDTFTVVVRHVALLFQPIAQGMAALEDGMGDDEEVPPFFALILEQLGFTFDKVMGAGSVAAIRAQLTAIATAYATIAPLVEGDDSPGLDDLPAIKEALTDIFTAVKELGELQLAVRDPDDALEHLGGVGQLLVEVLLTDYLEDGWPLLHNACKVLGIITAGKEDAATIAERLPRLRLERIADLLSDPARAFGERTRWGTDDFDPYAVLVPLAFFLDNCGFPAKLALPVAADAAKLGTGVNSADGLDISVRVPFARYEGKADGEDEDEAEAEAGFALLPLRADSGAPTGMALVPYGMGSTDGDADLGGRWRLEHHVDGNVEVRYGLVVDFASAEIRALDDDGSLPADIDLTTLAAVRREAEPGKRFTLFAYPGLGTMEVAQLGLQVGFRFDEDGAAFFAEVPVQGARLAVGTDKVDGFLKKVLPAGGFETTFDVTVGWSSTTGLYLRDGAAESDLRSGRGFAGSGSQSGRTGAGDGQAGRRALAAGAGPPTAAVAGGGSAGGEGFGTTLPTSTKLFDGLEIGNVDLRVKPGDRQVVVTARVSAALELGPIHARVQKVGVRLRLAFPADGRGNLGPLDLQPELASPAGAELSLGGAKVTGGGYLFYQEDKQEYAGVLAITVVGKLSLKVVGLITTRLPDGSPGFSLFLLVTADGFAPIQLGMGFTLNGVGGLFGVNRTVVTQALRDGLRQGTMGDVLFPENVVERAPTIVSNLGAVFPPSRGRYLFGPMAKLGWGTPTLVSLELAIILEIPDPVRLVVLGRLSVVLPDPSRPIVQIRLDTVGEIDFDRGTVTLDGVLFQSKVLDFPLTGAMALRARWRDDPFLIFSIGGFHPRFPVPEAVPALERLALSLANSESLRVRMEAYFALTSNTLQFGARAELFAKAGSLSVDAHLGFDALIQFSPFGFVVDASAGATLKLDGKVLAALRLDLVLSGPTPWHVHGKASVQILMVTWEVEVDYRVGPALPPAEPERTDVGALLRAALHDPRSWAGELPASAPPAVTLREAAVPGVVVHPLAELVVRQRIVPFDYAITRFGNNRPLDERVFTVEALVNGAAPATPPATVDEHFAVGQFRDLRDDQKLTAPSFVPLAAGYRFGDEAYDFDEDAALESSTGYETLRLQPA